MNRNLLAMLVLAAVGGCATEPVAPLPVHYGVEQVVIDGQARFVLCNPCAGPSPKRPDTETARSGLVYGEPVTLTVGQRWPLVSMAMVLAEMGVPLGEALAARPPGTPPVSDVAPAPIEAPPPEIPGPAVDAGPPLLGPDSDLEGERSAPQAAASRTQTVAVHFLHDSHELTADAIARMSELLQDSATAESLLVQGFTDSLGPKAYNDWLAQARTEAVRDWFLSRGVDPAKLRSDKDRTQGNCCYVADNAHARGRAANRRVEITLTF